MAARGRSDPERHPTERQNEYFIPGDGIMREVIQADICRYLGNDALVRPGNYQGRQGYFIRAYRNLTSEMISDLKEDSRRWANERTHLEQRYGYGQGSPARDSLQTRRPDSPIAPSYLSSNIHDERQQLGPTPGPGPMNPQSMQSMQSMQGQQQYGTQQYGSNQGGMIPQQQYGAQQAYGAQQQQQQPMQDNYGGQAYTYTSGPPSVTYPPSSVSHSSYDSSYQTQPRTANPHTASPYGDTANPYGGDPSDYTSQGGYYTANTVTTVSATQPNYPGTTMAQGYPTRDPVGYPTPRDPVGYQTDRGANAAGRHESAPRDSGHRDRRPRRN